MNHKYVVKFLSSFQDDHFVYITLEICRKKSMMELHKRRGPITEPEVRYFMLQICEGIDYLHNEKSLIHRDLKVKLALTTFWKPSKLEIWKFDTIKFLKLGNIFLDDKMHVKIGDFGLATEITREDERKKTLCGTPNYIAPEILTKKGHGFEVDIWSTGKFSAWNSIIYCIWGEVPSDYLLVKIISLGFCKFTQTLFCKK